MHRIVLLIYRLGKRRIRPVPICGRAGGGALKDRETPCFAPMGTAYPRPGGIVRLAQATDRHRSRGCSQCAATTVRALPLAAANGSGVRLVARQDAHAGEPEPRCFSGHPPGRRRIFLFLQIFFPSKECRPARLPGRRTGLGRLLGRPHSHGWHGACVPLPFSGGHQPVGSSVCALPGDRLSGQCTDL